MDLENRRRLLAAISVDPYILYRYPQLQDDEKFIRSAIRNENLCRAVMEWATPRFRSDPVVIKRLMKRCWQIIEFVNPDLLADRDFLMETFDYGCGLTLQFASPEILSDKQCVLLASFRYGSQQLHFASPELRDDPEVMLAATKASLSAIEFASDRLKCDRQFVLEAVMLRREQFAAWSNLPHALEFVDESFRHDYEIAMEAVKQNCMALDLLPEKFRADRHLVMAAVQASPYPWCLQWAAEPLNDDEEIVMAAVESCGGSLEFASERLKASRDIVLVAVRQDPRSIQFAADQLKANRKVVLMSLRRGHGETLQFASSELQGDRKVALFAVEAQHRNWVHVAKHLTEDKDFVLSALKMRVDIFHFLSTQLQNDIVVVYRAFRTKFVFFYSHFWTKKRYCNDLKARLGALGRAVLATNHYNLPQDSPAVYAEGWLSLVREKRWLLGQCGGGKCLPDEVQKRILEFEGGNEAIWAQELLAFDFLVSLMLERGEKMPTFAGWAEFWVECLKWDGM
ncbi:expressed unknown protein [Seminavis robusta]|uniref:DUF4116 domain-containing protein n=1 Tax=Seminavis robusta TaxID=568900 RepID=A0A9N8EM10_9STRA|nr:expressed unknown protein [Seminavis robusta]|eukprot:Sro1444_g273300.1 n/a (512) ;mRNA; f:23790-25325